MKDILMQRGKQLFTHKIEDAMSEIAGSKKYSDSDKTLIKTRLELLLSYFADKVSIMENIEWETFAADRLSKACSTVACDLEIVREFIVENTLTTYEETQIGHEVIRREPTEAEKAITKSLDDELKQNEIQYEQYDTIELIDDVDKKGLTSEGLRARGYLPSTFDSTVDDENELLIEEAKLAVIVSYDENLNSVYKCPNCYSNNLILETVNGSCLDCDYEFAMKNISINDNLPEFHDDRIITRVSEEETEDVYSILRAKRISGEKKNRGLIIPGDPDFNM